MAQAEWVAALEKVSGGRTKASKKDMDGWVSPSASVRRRQGFARDTDRNTTRRYEHTDMKFALGKIGRPGEVDQGRAEDVRMAGILGTPFNLPVRAIAKGCNVGLWSGTEPSVMSDRRGYYNG